MRSGCWCAALGFLIAATVSTVHAQRGSDVPAWQKAAGGSMQFGVASIRPDDGPFHPPSFALSADDWFREPNGRFHADFTVATYIEFAYKLWLTGEQRRVMLEHLPAWVGGQRYAIEATAPLHATKDQYRLMMQQLLAERFALKLHFEEREMPVLVMTLEKPGKTGPRLIPHEQGPACDAKATADVYPSECYSFSMMPKDGQFLLGSRGTSMELIAEFLGNLGGSGGEITRPVIDRTGLRGQWDFTLMAVAPPKEGATDPPAGPTLLEAIHEQLGIALKPARAMVQVPIVDHVDRPSEN